MAVYFWNWSAIAEAVQLSDKYNKLVFWCCEYCENHDLKFDLWIMNHGLLIQTLDPITFSDGGESEQCFKEM